MVTIRKEITVGIALVIGTIVMLDYIVVFDPIQTIAKYSMDSVVIVQAFAYILGGVIAARRDVIAVIKRGKYWFNSAVMLVTLAVTVIIGTVWGFDHPIYYILFNNMLQPMTLVTAGFMTFYMASATFRVFRAKNLNSSVLLAAGVLMMLRNAPIGSLIWPGFGTLGNFLLSVPQIGGNRGVILGSAIVSVFFGLRVLLGYEQRWTGSAD